MNLFAYCGNNPVMRVDPTGHAWWHWAIAATVVVVAVAVVVVTAGGAAPAVAALAAAAGSGAFTCSTVTAVAAGVAVGSGLTLGVMAMDAAATSSSVKEFNDKGNWGTVGATAVGGAIGGGSAYLSTKGTPSKPSPKSTGKAFDPKGPKVQIGVDPKTLTPSKNLATLDPARLKNAEIYGRDQALSVYRNGVIEDGNHRLANALANNRAVDIVIFP